MNLLICPESEAEIAAYHVRDYTLRLTTHNGECSLNVQRKDGSVSELDLQLHAPCFMVLNHDVAAGEHAESGGVQVAEKNQPMAWRYADRHVIVVIAVGAASAERGRLCSAESRGVLLREPQAALSLRRPDIIHCLGSGEDEKEFWLFAHE